MTQLLLTSDPCTASVTWTSIVQWYTTSTMQINLMNVYCTDNRIVCQQRNQLQSHSSAASKQKMGCSAVESVFRAMGWFNMFMQHSVLRLLRSCSTVYCACYVIQIQRCPGQLCIIHSRHRQSMPCLIGVQPW